MYEIKKIELRSNARSMKVLCIFTLLFFMAKTARMRNTNVIPLRTAWTSGNVLTAVFSINPRLSFHLPGMNIISATATGTTALTI
jgi:hypothetical protein